ncbi:PD-(D/E)XK nuclease family protein [Pseudoramibacter faecis]|uniref:PD-(D/E)XK nuclease family protein n=1 Tax=Pseudoramibacter faecis TaxID=3108534 RepID=UPI002E75E9A7|nr:PD-(D/E)XK nuclease family protein [Pseudoramibacter sp. HA2172]
MTIRLITGRGAGSARQKTQIVYRQIHQKLMAGADRCFLIVPESFTYSAERGLIDATGMRGLMGAEVMSLDRLATRVFSEAGGATAHFIDGHGQRMLLTKSILSSRDALQIYGKSVGRRGFLRDMEDFIGELKESHIEGETLKQKCAALPEASLLSRKLADAGTIYDAYEATLGADRLDEVDRARLLCKKIGQTAFLKDASIWLDKFYTFSEKDFEVIAALAARASTLTMTLLVDEDPAAGDGEIFAIARKTRARMQTLAETLHRPFEVETVGGNQKTAADLAHLEHEWFAAVPRAYHGAASRVSLHACTDLWQEAEKAAQQIVSWTRDQGYRYGDMTILVGSPETMGEGIARALAMYEIPSFVDRLEPVTGHPLVAFLFAALDAVRYHFEGSSVTVYAKTAFSGLDRDLAMDLENYAKAFGIAGWRWQQPFEQNDPRDGRRSAETLWNLAALNAAKETLLAPLTALSRNFEKPAVYAVYLRALVQFLEATEVQKQLDVRADAAMAAGDYKTAAINNQIWNTLMTVFEQIDTALGSDTGDIAAFIQILQSGIETYHVGVLPEQRDAVAITDALRSRSDGTKILMILGANEGMLPAEHNRFPVLTDRERGIVGLQNDSRYLQTREAYVLYMQVSGVSDALYCSYAMNDADGKSLRPSHLVQKLKLIFPTLPMHSAVADDAEAALDWVTGTAATVNTLLLKRAGEADPVTDAVSAALAKGADAAPAFFPHRPGIAPATAAALYDQPLQVSVSRVERFNACPFAYFVDYGLRPVPIDPFEVTPPDIGQVMHALIERLFKWAEEQGTTLDALPAADRAALVNLFLADLLAHARHDVFNRSGKFRYQGRKLHRVGVKTLAALSDHLTRGAFTFRCGEQFFDAPLPLAGGEAAVRGIVDRIDTYRAGEETFVKIIDYKTGNREVSPAEIYYGLSLQLLVYMDASLQMLSSEGQKALPGGAFYFHVDDPAVESDSRDALAVQREQLEAFRMNGIYLDDARVMQALDDSGAKKSPVYAKGSKASRYDLAAFNGLLHYARQSVKQSAEAMLAGNIAVSPYQLKGAMACDRCAYQSICGYDAQISGDACRRLNGDISKEQLVAEAEALDDNPKEDNDAMDA